jgi:hypothetical protein
MQRREASDWLTYPAGREADLFVRIEDVSGKID